jgi:hypothetical protein
MALVKLEPMAKSFGGGEFGRALAARILEIQNDFTAGTLASNPGTASSKPSSTAANPTPSNSLRLDPT